MNKEFAIHLVIGIAATGVLYYLYRQYVATPSTNSPATPSSDNQMIQTYNNALGDFGLD